MQHLSRIDMEALMTRRYKQRKLLSIAELNTVWREWRAGATGLEIGRALEASAETVRLVIVRRGGVAPEARRRAKHTLTLAEREEISRGIARDEGVRELARRLGRLPSTISREIARHGGRTQYRARTADARAWHRARRPKRCRLVQSAQLCAVVTAKLRQQWAPEQIAAWLQRTYPSDATMHVS